MTAYSAFDLIYRCIKSSIDPSQLAGCMNMVELYERNYPDKKEDVLNLNGMIAYRFREIVDLEKEYYHGVGAAVGSSIRGQVMVAMVHCN